MAGTRMRMRIKGLSALLAILLSAAPVFAYMNPGTATAGTYTPIAASSTPVTINSALTPPLYVHRLEIQNNCGSAVTVQFNGVGASALGFGYTLAPGEIKTWRDTPIPQGPYSFVTAGASCTPDTGTGLSLLEQD
jgi:hypothetical protein